MPEVACFCGCCYSFRGDGAACPRCGEYASIGPSRPATGTDTAVDAEPIAHVAAAPHVVGRHRCAATAEALVTSAAG